jgi:hypothetical protein
MITGVALDAGDRRVASASWDKTVRLWELPRVAPSQHAMRLSRRPPSPPLPADQHEALGHDQGSVTAQDAPAGGRLLKEAEAAIQSEAWDAALDLARQLRELQEPLPDPATQRLWHNLAKECVHTDIRGLSAIATIASS